MNHPSLDLVLAELGMSDKLAGTSAERIVAKKRLLQRMNDPNIEILGIVYSFILDTSCAQRIEPALEFDDYHHFLLRYYERCFRENPESAWADSRYSAGSDLVNWFGKVWHDKQLPRFAIDELKEMIGRLYKEGDRELRTCITTATLEHLFEQAQIRKYFADWRKDPVLSNAYNEAVEWVRSGGDSPLGKSPKGK